MKGMQCMVPYASMTPPLPHTHLTIHTPTPTPILPHPHNHSTAVIKKYTLHSCSSLNKFITLPEPITAFHPTTIRLRHQYKLVTTMTRITHHQCFTVVYYPHWGVGCVWVGGGP
jgi:hypothetical protein